MARNYQTSPTSFISKFDEKVYEPNRELVKAFQKCLDMIPQDNLALTIDQIVYDLMRAEGYGQPQRYLEMRDPELLATPPIKGKDREYGITA